MYVSLFIGNNLFNDKQRTGFEWFNINNNLTMRLPLMNTGLKGLLFLLLCCYTSSIVWSQIANDRYWVATTDSNWNDSNNWPDTDGGTSGFSVPNNASSVYFTSSHFFLQ